MTAARDLPSAAPDPSGLWTAPRAHGPVDLTVGLPGSKSITNRALVLAAIAEGPSTVHRALRSRDTELMAVALTALGSAVDTSGEDWLVTPGPWQRPAHIDCGLAGTVMRFVPPLAGLAQGAVSFDGDPHMRNRPVGEVLTALGALGVEVTVAGDHAGLPFQITGQGGVRGGTVVIDASASSQFISGLLLAGARYDQGVDVRHVGKPVPSLPHIDMTVSMLRQSGVDVDDSDANRWSVAPGTVRAVDRTIEPDLSNAAAFVALAAVAGGTVRIPGWPRHTTQAGDALRDILELAGCTVALDDEGLTVSGDGQPHGIDVDLHDVGELTPVVAALCALADSPSHLRGIGHIRGHETDRLAALAAELNSLGAEVTEHADGLSFDPARLHGGVFRTYADHRMAHAGVVIGAAVDGVRIENVETTSKTFPGFAQYWASLL